MAEPVASGTYTNRFTPHGYELLVIGPADSYTQWISSSGAAVVGTVTTDMRLGDVVFTETSGGACHGLAGTYRLSVQPDGFDLTPDHDPCEARRADFSAAPWKPYLEHTSQS